METMMLCQGEIQSHCTDISDSALALVRSAIHSRSIDCVYTVVQLITYNQEQFNNLRGIIDEVMYNFTNYYYAAGENYTEHPYYMVELEEGQQVDDFHEKYYDKNPLFKVEYEKLSDTNIKVLFSIKDRDKYLQALDGYCFNYGYDCVENDECNILTCEAQNKQLYNLLTENDYNLSNFIVNDLKYIKALCYNEYKDKLSMHNFCLDFDKDNKLIFKCMVDATYFVKNYGKDDIAEGNNKGTKSKTDKPKKRRPHFTQAVQELYDYIKTRAELRKYNIYIEDLVGEDRRNKLYTSRGTLTTMVSRLNEQYREMTLDDTVTLMRYSKTDECYIIKDIWNNETVIH